MRSKYNSRLLTFVCFALLIINAAAINRFDDSSLVIFAAPVPPTSGASGAERSETHQRGNGGDAPAGAGGSSNRAAHIVPHGARIPLQGVQSSEYNTGLREGKTWNQVLRVYSITRKQKRD